MSEVKRSVA